MPLKVSDGIGAWIKDFKKSDAPQFKGKSDKERRDQAIAAYLSAKKGPQEAVDPKAAVKDRINRLQNKRQSARAAAAETDSPSDRRRHAMKAQIAQKQIQMAQQRMGQMEAYGASNPKFNAQDMVGHNNKKVFKQKREDSIDELKIGTYQNYMKKANQQIKKSNTKKYQDHLDKHGVTPDGKTAGQDIRRIGNRERGMDKAMSGVNRKRAAAGKDPKYMTKAMRQAQDDKMPKKRGRPRSLSYGYSKPEMDNTGKKKQ